CFRLPGMPDPNAPGRAPWTEATRQDVATSVDGVVLAKPEFLRSEVYRKALGDGSEIKDKRPGQRDGASDGIEQDIAVARPRRSLGHGRLALAGQVVAVEATDL